MVPMGIRFAAVIIGLAVVAVPACASSSPSGSPDAPPSTPQAAPHESLALGGPLPDESLAHISLSLRLWGGDGGGGGETALAQLLADQQDPASPRYHAWLTPAQFGDAFGQPEATYSRIVAWLRAGGFAVTPYPNRLFLEASGTTAAVRELLRVQLRSIEQGEHVFRTVAEEPSLPADIAPVVMRIGGLDTRTHIRRSLYVSIAGARRALDATDLRALYDVPSKGVGASGLTLVVLGTQEGTQASTTDTPGPPLVPPSPDAINEYFATFSGATASYDPIVLPNDNDDYDVSGANEEYELDVEMQSIGAPNAKSIDLVLAPPSEVFQLGAQYIVNKLWTAVAVSTSLGFCEPVEVAASDGGVIPSSDAEAFRLALQQGLAEGQSWFAASGDTGADACNDATSGTGSGFGGGNATVGFPCSVPEVVCLGGTQLEQPVSWGSNGTLAGWQPETVWNEGAQGASGGGQSLLYAKPPWQIGVGSSEGDTARDVPDLALTAATMDPGVEAYVCGSGQDPLSCGVSATDAGPLEIVGGTSVAAPLAAGFFARLAGQVGCRLGDAHPVIYALGAAEQSGGAQPFHDITSGNNSFRDPAGETITGFTAGPGYDLASGWGSVDLGQLIDSWPSCVPGGGGAVPLPEASGGCSSAPYRTTPRAWTLGAALALTLAITALRRRR